jgi:hypothetical protein
VASTVSEPCSLSPVFGGRDGVGVPRRGPLRFFRQATRQRPLRTGPEARPPAFAGTRASSSLARRFQSLGVHEPSRADMGQGHDLPGLWAW